MKGKCCVFLTHDSYMREGSCPICSYNIAKAQKKGPTSLTTAHLQVEIPVGIQRGMQLGIKSTNKTLIEAVCNENKTAAMVTCFVPVGRGM